MKSIQSIFFLLLFLTLAFALGVWLYSYFASGVREFSRVVPISAYLDSQGNFLICVQNMGPHDFYGVLVVSTHGNSTPVQLYAAVGQVAEARGSLQEQYVSGTSPILYVVTGGGSSYTVVPIVVVDVSEYRCK